MCKYYFACGVNSKRKSVVLVIIIDCYSMVCVYFMLDKHNAKLSMSVIRI